MGKSMEKQYAGVENDTSPGSLCKPRNVLKPIMYHSGDLQAGFHR